MLQVLNFEFLKLRILEIFRFTHDSQSLIANSKDAGAQADLSLIKFDKGCCGALAQFISFIVYVFFILIVSCLLDHVSFFCYLK